MIPERDPKVTFIETCRLIHQDYRRYLATGRGKANGLSVVLLTQGLWASFVYRWAHWCVVSNRSRPVAWMLRFGYVGAGKLIEVLTGIRLSPGCRIGGGLYMAHFGPIRVNHRVRIGENCNLSQGVTIGEVQSGDRKGVPTIGNRVYLGTNAILIGNIEVGDDVAIGAGSVVIESVSSCAVVVGNPGRVVSFKGSFELISYDGMGEDTDRLRSMGNNPESSLGTTK